MKILQINAVYGIGSTGKTTEMQQNYINEKTENIFKSAFCYGGTNADGYIIGSKLDRKIHALLSRLTGLQGCFSKKATKKLLKFIDDYAPDVIGLGNLHGNYVNFPLLFDYIAKKEIPVIITLHDCWPFTGKCCHYTTDKCYKWQTGCYGCIRMKKDNKSYFFDRSSLFWKMKKTLYDKMPYLTVVGVSDWITNESKKSPLFENAKVFRRIYNGIDCNLFFPQESDLREKYGLEGKKVILAVSSDWKNSKGFDDIFKLADILQDDCKIVIIGKHSGRVHKKVICILHTDNQTELAKWYSASDAFINMSKEESFGKVSAEALMCGTPVICFDSTANPELVGEGCGYVCKSNSIEEFAKMVKKVLEDGKEAYSERCLKFAKENFASENMIGEYLELYRELAEMKRKV